MSQRRRKPSSPQLPNGASHDSITPPLGYVLEWTPQSHHRHRLDGVANLRAELLGGEPPGVEQLIVLRGALAADVGDALRSLAGIDASFLDAYAQSRPFRPRGRAKGARWWTWRYPEATAHGSVAVRRAALWLSSPIPVLLVDTPLGHEAVRHGKPAPRLRHQDAATRRSALQHGAAGGRYGAVARCHASPPLQQQQHHHDDHAEKPTTTTTRVVKALDDELGAAMDYVEDVVVEEMLAELVYERWTACLSTLQLGDARSPRLLWNYMVALEHNLDDARYCARQGRFVEHASPPAWTDLAQRAQLRIQLAAAAAAASSSSRHRHRDSSSSSSSSSPAHDDSTANERSLDRIAYLGGALLPVTVVASILAIEGRYGPEGGQFWVFWAASVAASVVALLVIYLDQLRLADVWVELPSRSRTEEVAVGGGLGVVVDGTANAITTAARAWHRERLGWVRAVKQATGYYRLRGARWIRFQSPAKADEDRREDFIVVEEE